MSRFARFALALGLAAAAASAATLTGCTRAKPLPTASAVSAAFAPTLSPAADATPGATVVSVGPAPATPIQSAGVSATATPTPVPDSGASPTPATQPTVGPATQYTVAYGDTLYGIARKFGTTAQAIADANGISVDTLINAGQSLTVPGATPQETGEYVVQPGDTLYSIAARYSTTAAAIAAANQIMNPSLLKVGQRLVIPQAGEAAPPGGEKVHIVQPGETLYRIAIQYGKTVQEIAVANNLPNSNSIRVGQRLIIP
jgi:LysM repeat protein